MSLRAVVADDQRIVREALVAMLQGWADIEVVGQASDGADAVSLVRALRPDILITDLSMPVLNGVEALRRLRRDGFSTRVLCLSVHTEDLLVLSAIEAGANGYLPKACSSGDLRQAITRVMQGELVVCPSLVGVLVQAVRAHSKGAEPDVHKGLSGREREVLQLLAEGHSTRDIALRLHLSAKTVGTHRQHIQQKLGARTLAEMTRHALKMGLTSLH